MRPHLKTERGCKSYKHLGLRTEENGTVRTVNGWGEWASFWVLFLKAARPARPARPRHPLRSVACNLHATKLSSLATPQQWLVHLHSFSPLTAAAVSSHRSPLDDLPECFTRLPTTQLWVPSWHIPTVIFNDFTM